MLNLENVNKEKIDNKQKKCTRLFCKYKTELEPYPHSHKKNSEEDVECECGHNMIFEYCCWGSLLGSDPNYAIYDHLICMNCEREIRIVKEHYRNGDVKTHKFIYK